MGAGAHWQARGGDRASRRNNHHRGPHALAEPTRGGICACFRGPEDHSRGARSHACQGRDRHRGSTRNSVLPANDRGIAQAVAATIRLQQERFDGALEVARLAGGRNDIGAIVTFTGLCRGEEAGLPLVAMTLEHYPGMAEAEIARHVEAAEKRWPLLGVTVIHRFGRLTPGEEIVLVIAVARHRQDAFAAAEFLMDYLKTRAPFGNHVETAAGTSWVEARHADNISADRWASSPSRQAAAE